MTRQEKKNIVDEATRMCVGVYTKEHPGGLPEEQRSFVRVALAIMDADIAKRNPRLHAAMLESRAKGF